MDKIFEFRDFRPQSIKKRLEELNDLVDSGWRFYYTGEQRRKTIINNRLFRVHLIKDEVNLEDLTKMNDLRLYAEEHDVEVPDDIKQSQKLKKHIRDSLGVEPFTDTSKEEQPKEESQDGDK